MIRLSARYNKADRVKWQEWSAETFEHAQREDKPVMVFLWGFWCGFCQQMDEKVFSNDEVTALLNAYFIPVRVEDIQRPDIDVRYSKNGVPSIAFLTPEGEHMGTVNTMEAEPFADLLVKMHLYYREHKDEIGREAEKNRTLAALRRPGGVKGPVNADVIGKLAGIMEGIADPENGGYGLKHKVLHPYANELFLYLHQTTREPQYLNHVDFTLNKMRESRIHDADAGGFFRYSSKMHWNQPHPEKMLTDQAGMLGNYVHAYLATGHPEHRETAEKTVNYLESTLLDQTSGAYFGSEEFALMPAEDHPRMTPFIDPSIYVDANAQAASALLDAWWVIGDKQCRDRAETILNFLWKKARGADGLMRHYWHQGELCEQGTLTDDVLMGKALLDAYRVTGKQVFLTRAHELGQAIVQGYLNPEGGFSDIRKQGPGNLRHPLVMLPPNALAADFLMGLAVFTGEMEYRQVAEWALREFTQTFAKYEAYAANYGIATGKYLYSPLAVTVSGPAGSEQVRALARGVLTEMAHPHIALTFQEEPSSQAALHLGIGGQVVGPITDAGQINRDALMAGAAH